MTGEHRHDAGQHVQIERNGPACFETDRVRSDRRTARVYTGMKDSETLPCNPPQRRSHLFADMYCGH